MNNNKKSPLMRINVTAEKSLLDQVQQRKREIEAHTGLRLSTSSTISALIRAGIESPLNKMTR
jgi:hypothetical protein